MISLILFFFGVAIGSFLNVVILRYNGERFLLDVPTLSGRSHCPHCGKILQWYELIPILSFLIQRGRCRNCGVKLSIQYPLVELASALIFVFVPLRLAALFGPGADLSVFAVLWVVALELLLVVSVIDLRMGIIPDEANVALAIVGLFTGLFAQGYFGTGNQSLLGPYALVFGAQWNLVLAHVIGALIGGLFFLALVVITKGKGMGMGDVKLAFALGFLFGWPDIAPVVGISFILGAIAGVSFIAVRKKTMRSAIPFGPFLALGSAAVFFFGAEMFGAYFRLMGL